MRTGLVPFFVALVLLCESGSDVQGLFLPTHIGTTSTGVTSLSSSLLELRGGAKKRGSSVKPTKTVTGKKKVRDKFKAEKKSPVSKVLENYRKVLPYTRAYITAIGVCTLLGVVLGEELSQSILALDPLRTLAGGEIWRFFTAASYLGTPSVTWLLDSYYLLQYGSSLEQAYGAAQYLVFLFSQLAILSILSILFGQPFFARSMITAMLHVLSRAMPKQQVRWLIFTVPYWSLPYGLMATDVLQAQSAGAAVPHILGIISGHFFHFHRFIWPKVGGEDWLKAPAFLSKYVDPAPRADAAKESVSRALKSRRKGKGKKLGL
eukprot:Nitzschia sp. Nitz4//scaffold1_size375055//301654//302613//NITZ4_000318-RA/size375055-processed-gene-0.460-mRNA-1//-1//CDS//3329541171//1624//frame0